MRRLTSILKYSVFARTKIPLRLGYPFQYTLSSQQFAFMDIRFTQVPFSRELWAPQKQHIHLVLQNLEDRLNNNTRNAQMDKFITNGLKSKVEELRDIFKESNIQLNFDLDLQSVDKSSGYYEIKPDFGLSLDEKVIEEIHNYKFTRDNEVLTVSRKEKKVELTPEEQLKKDLMDKMGGQRTKQIRQQFDKMTVSKHAVFYNKLVDGFLSIGKKQKKNTKFQPYYVIDQIKGKFTCQMRHQMSLYQDNQIQFDSKWLYLVTNLESSDLKKYRRRTLFDFQYWSRGSFFPIHNFVADIADS